MVGASMAPTARSQLAHAPPPGNDKARELGGGAGLGGTAVQNGQRDCGAALDPTQGFLKAIFERLGYAPERIEPGRIIRFATKDRRNDDAGWCILFNDLRGGMFADWRSGVTETWSVGDRDAMTPAQRVEHARLIAAALAERMRWQREQWIENEKNNAALLAKCVRVTEGDPVHRYLCRKLAIDEFIAPACIRLHRALPYYDGNGKKLGEFPVMVAQVVTPDGSVVALHRTYLTDDGHKADVPTVRKLTRVSSPTTGASIRLASPRVGVLGVAEGIETALAASLGSGVPTVAARDAGALATYQWPISVRRLVIFADNDKAGRDAADALRNRALAARLACEVRTPTDEGADWCDVWAQRVEETPA